jgi:dTDP-4-dehydrorhamnose reductase
VAIARAAAECGAVCVHLSTDFVFSGLGDRPYAPAHPPEPLGVYGRTKLEGEEAVRAIAPNHIVVRTSWVYGAGGPNFVTAVSDRARAGKPLRVVADQVGRPTWARNLAGIVLELVERRAKGVWHATDAGEASWHELATEALRLQEISAEVVPVTTEEWGAPAPRPKYSVLDTSGTEDFLRRPLMHWREALRRFLAELSNQDLPPA